MTMVLSRKTMMLGALLLLLLGSSNAAEQGCTVDFADSRTLIDFDDETLCSSDNCFWIAATEQDGTDTGRCYQCSQQQSRNGCASTNICFWLQGRDELGGKDCTLCAGRNQEDCESTSYCFWDLEGYEGVCTKCPGYTDSNSCAAAGCFWRNIKGVDKCVKCGGFQTQEDCEATGCKWNPDAGVKCGGNSDIHLLPLVDTTTTSSSSPSRVWIWNTVFFGAGLTLSVLLY